MKINDFVEFLTDNYINFIDCFKAHVPAHMDSGDSFTNACGGLLIPFSGSATFAFNDKTYELAPGMMMHAGPNMPLRKLVTSDETWGFFLCHYEIVDPESISAQLYHQHFVLECSMSVRLNELLHHLLLAYETPSTLGNFSAKVTFMNMLEELILCMKNVESDLKLDVMNQAMVYLQNNYAKNIMITDLAEHFQMERRRFSEEFKNQTGKTPSQFLTEYRIRKAKEILTYRKFTVEEVARKVGYKDALYFSRVFKQQVGICPSKYCN